MATVPPPPVSLLQVGAVFGTSAPVALSWLTRGGGRVPNIPQNGHVPTVLPLGITQLTNATDYSPFTVRVQQQNGTYQGPEQIINLHAHMVVTITGGSGNISTNWELINPPAGREAKIVNVGRNAEVSAFVRRGTELTLVCQLTINDGTTFFRQTYPCRLYFAP